MFVNLYFLQDSPFQNHNFSDFWNYGGGGAPIERVDASAIRHYIRRSYVPDPKRSGRLQGFPPDFNPVVPMTLSLPCCESFIRANPALPITPRDYYLSKLFQFIYDTLIERFEIDLSDSGVRMQLHELLERIPKEWLPPNDRAYWPDLWWDFYTVSLEKSLIDVLQLLENQVSAILAPIAKPRHFGPRPAIEDYEVLARIVEQIDISGRDWKHEIPTICSQLDKRKVPCYAGRDRKIEISWAAKVRLPGGTEKVKKDIQYRLGQAAKASIQST